MSNAALIIGGNVAGLQAAVDLADAGIKVHLVESSPFLGNAGETSIPRHILNARMLEVARHPNVTIWTNTRINRAEGKVRDYKVELRQHPRYVDLSRCTACGECIAVCPVTAPGNSHKAIHIDGQPECMAIEKLGKPPCANTCPGGIHVQGYVAFIAQGRFQEAIDLVREAIPFPGICGRVCTHPCEVNCRRAEIDKPVAVRLLKRFISDWEFEHGSEAGVRGRTGETEHLAIDPKRVAIIGAGPGGMAVADRLARLGHQVAVFEKLPVIGGMMAVGIPGYRLPGEIIQREYQHILDLGVEIQLNTTIGPGGDHTLDDLFDMGYEAVCLAIGAHRSQLLHIPGEDLTGVIHGIELLKIINLSQRLEYNREEQSAQYDLEIRRLIHKGRETRVGILGGGNTAMDVSRSLKRLGVQDVRILYRRTLKEMPAMPEEIEDARKEGVEIEFLVSPVRVLGDEKGNVTGLECIRTKLGEPDSSGRRRPVPIAGSEFVVDLDLIVLAVGQAPDFSCLEGKQPIAITRDERINVTEPNFVTSRKGVFAVGDAVTSDKMVVIEAIGMGKKAAIAIDAFLSKQHMEEIVVDSREVPIARRDMAGLELIIKPRTVVPTIPMEKRLSSFSEVELGFSAEQAIAEAQRCLICGPCSECMACVRVCKTGAIIHDQQETYIELNIGAVLIADDQININNLPLTEGKGVYRLPPDNALLGSVAAASAMLDLGYHPTKTKIPTLAPVLPVKEEIAHIGVFICQCGGEISQVIDNGAVLERMAALPGVAYTRELPFSCSPAGVQDINEEVKIRGLTHVVLASCSCCTIDQVCYSCTYQRIRCKQNLGLFKYSISSSEQTDRRIKFGLVNIREQCAWVHADDPQAATDKAIALIEAAIVQAQTMSPGSAKPQPVDRSVVILGSGSAAPHCQKGLKSQGILVQRVKVVPDQVKRINGQYIVIRDGTTWHASGLVLTPGNEEEEQVILAAFGQERHRPRIHIAGDGLETHRPGVYFCSPALDPETAGMAAAARITAWLGRVGNRAPVALVVNPARCRACGDCIDICEFGAPMLVEEDMHTYSWIDPLICTGCGICVPHCPSGAIRTGFSSDAEIEAMLGAILRSSTLVPEKGSHGNP